MTLRLLFALLLSLAFMTTEQAMAQAAETPAPETPEAPSEPAPPSAQVPTVQLTIVMVEGSKIIGAPVDLTALPLLANFGEIEVALTLIQQLSFTKDRTSVVVKFRNGDQLTGALLLKQIKIKTAFGQATIPMERIATVTIAPK